MLLISSSQRKDLKLEEDQAEHLWDRFTATLRRHRPAQQIVQNNNQVLGDDVEVEDDNQAAGDGVEAEDDNQVPEANQVLVDNVEPQIDNNNRHHQEANRKRKNSRSYNVQNLKQNKKKKSS